MKVVAHRHSPNHPLTTLSRTSEWLHTIVARFHLLVNTWPVLSSSADGDGTGHFYLVRKESIHVDMQRWTQAMLGGETAVESFMAALEAIFVSIIGRVAVWFTPLPSAVLVARSATRVFELGGLWPWVMAGVIELVGLVTSNLWLTAKEWNRNKNKSDPKANEVLAFGLMVSYFITTGLLLLAFEIPHVAQTGSIVGLTALLFPVLSAVGIISLNERILHNRRQTEKISKKRANVMLGNTKANTTPNTLHLARKAKRDERLNNLVHFYSENPNATMVQAGEAVGVARQTVSIYLSELEQAGRVSRNGDGVEVLN